MKGNVKDFYDRFDGERFYNGIPMICAPGVHEMVAEASRRYLGESGRRVLDVGCGQGALSLRLADLGYEVDACDLLDHCKCKDRVRFICSAAEDVHFECVYDGIFIIEVIEHVEAPFELLRHYAQYLKPGGYLFVSTPNVESDFSRVWFMMKGEHWYFRQNDFDTSGHIMPVHQFQMDYILPQLGLSQVEETRIPEHRKFGLGAGYVFSALLRGYQKVRAARPVGGAVRLWVLKKDTEPAIHREQTGAQAIDEPLPSASQV